jgi:hypothetical protein
VKKHRRKKTFGGAKLPHTPSKKKKKQKKKKLPHTLQKHRKSFWSGGVNHLLIVSKFNNLVYVISKK